MQAWTTSSTKRAAAKDKVLNVLDEHIKSLQAHRDAVVAECDRRQEAWDGHNDKVKIVISKVAAVLAERLKAAQDEAGVIVQVEAVEVVAPIAPVVDAPPASQQELDYYRSVPWQPSELPQNTPEPKEGEYDFWLRLANNVQEWTHTHGCQPCTYLELLSDGEKTETPESLTMRMESLANLVGMDYWRKLYDSRVVMATDVVPHHLGFVLYQAMLMPRQAAEKALGEKKMKEAAKEAKATIKAAMADAKARPKVGRFVKNVVSK